MSDSLSYYCHDCGMWISRKTYYKLKQWNCWLLATYVQLNSYLNCWDVCWVGVVGVLGVVGSLRCRGGPTAGPVKPFVGVALPGLWGVEEWGENVGVVGLDLTELPKATVGVVALVVKIWLLGLPPIGVGVFRPVIFEDEVLRRLERFKFPVEPNS